MEKMFEKAIRGKVRFDYKGVIGVEDLFDLRPEELDSIYKSLNGKLKEVKEESLLKTKTKADELLELKIEIVKHVFTTKVEEAAVRAKAKETKEKNQKILEIIANKENEGLQGKSIEELRAMLEAGE